MIEFIINWTKDTYALDEGWGYGILKVNNVPIWYENTINDPKPVLWSWIELLEFINSRLSYIINEHNIRYGLNPLKLRDYGIDDEEVYHFEGRHDLARGIHGMFLPTIMLVREHDYIRIITEDQEYKLSINDVISSFVTIGKKIIERISLSNKPRVTAAINEWNDIMKGFNLFSVAGLLFIDKKVVAVSRKTNHNDFGLFGGKIDPGETPEQALIREAFEETSIIVLKYRPVYEDLCRVENGESRPARVYLIEEYEGFPQATTENAVVKLLDPKQLMNPSNTFSNYNYNLFNSLSKQGILKELGIEDDTEMVGDLEITRVHIPRSNPYWPTTT